MEKSSQESSLKVHGSIPIESTETKQSSPLQQSQNIPESLPKVEKGE